MLWIGLAYVEVVVLKYFEILFHNEVYLADITFYPHKGFWVRIHGPLKG